MQAIPTNLTDRWPHLIDAFQTLTPQQRRRLQFIRVERLSASEACDLPGDFDPGPEYEPPAPAPRVS